LYGKVSIPLAVEQEIRPSGLDPANITWIEVAPPVDARAVDELHRTYPRLGPGEAEAIVLALRTGARLLIDERLSTRIADERGIRHAGVLGVLLAAKSAGFVAELRPHLDELQAGGFYLTPLLISAVLRRAGET
jgi:predicted nucleic acid-binding protein